MVIDRQDFLDRVNRLKEHMRTRGIDACFVYGDEYRRENLRYMSNFWPIFERGAVLIPRDGSPIVLGAPEGEMLCREMSVWDDIRLVPEFACVTVPEEIEYPQANYTTFRAVFDEIRSKSKLKMLGITGIDAMSAYLFEHIKKSAGDAEVVDANDILNTLRLTKSRSEINAIRKAIEIADYGYLELLRAARPGVTELELAGAATGEVMKRGAEYSPFCLVASGDRVNTIIGRATEKVIKDGDMVMAALSVQYEGYIATINFPFVVGTASPEQERFITYLVEAYEIALSNLRAGVPQNRLVSAVKNYFRENNLEKYDLYPPLHGCGLCEAESPYPNEAVTSLFETGMTVNTDISLFGHPHGSNRIEAGFIVTDNGYESPSRLILKLLKTWKETRDYKQAII